MGSTEMPRVAVVTDCNAGIGQATAIALARLGFDLALHYFGDENGARQTFDRIRAMEHARARVYACDLGDPGQLVLMAGDMLADFEGVDVLIHCSTGRDMDSTLCEKLARAFLPHMIQRHGGSILNVLTFDEDPDPEVIRLAGELTAYGVRLNCVKPGKDATREQVAEAIASLCSNQAFAVSGECISV